MNYVTIITTIYLLVICTVGGLTIFAVNRWKSTPILLLFTLAALEDVGNYLNLFPLYTVFIYAACHSILYIITLKLWNVNLPYKLIVFSTVLLWFFLGIHKDALKYIEHILLYKAILWLIIYGYLGFKSDPSKEKNIKRWIIWFLCYNSLFTIIIQAYTLSNKTIDMWYLFMIIHSICIPIYYYTYSKLVPKIISYGHT